MGLNMIVFWQCEGCDRRCIVLHGNRTPTPRQVQFRRLKCKEVPHWHAIVSEHTPEARTRRIHVEVQVPDNVVAVQAHKARPGEGP